VRHAAPQQMTGRAFVDYYRGLGISPVRQDLTDLDQHFARRHALYHLLGVLPALVRGRDVLEFGPGSGDNALYTASLGPRRYVLVDANPTGLAHVRERLGEMGGAESIDIVESMIESFPSPDRFDLVLAEGLIATQQDPDGLTRRIASFVRGGGGVLVITCVDSASFIAEVYSRILADHVAPRALPVRERVERLRPFFAPRLATLDGMSRSVDDWILDNITQPFSGRLFGIADALRVCGAEFDVLGSSPRFTIDWRWYKTLRARPFGFNERAATSYYANVLNLLDYRVELPPHDPALGRAVLAVTDRLWRLSGCAETGEPCSLAEAAATLEELAVLVAPHSRDTAGTLSGVARAMQRGVLPEAEPVSHFGRGQQYLSLVRG
jgi:SAM-dependent methyltransferase